MVNEKSRDYDYFNFLHLTPLIPLSFQERGRNKKEGASPPLKTTSPFPRWEGGQGDGVNVVNI
jgi:hypothetical protein